MGLQQVIEYLGRYTHKVAITNNRIKKSILILIL
ncbi:MAG: transposase [Saprospiraceae bacterium]|nr:transposase [Saprospiraceae bacterium]